MLAERCHHLAVCKIGHVEDRPGLTNICELQLGLAGDGGRSEVLLIRERESS